MKECKDCIHTKGNDVSNFPCLGCYSGLNRDRPNFKGKLSPEIVVTNFRLECPTCHHTIKYKTCGNCGQMIDTSEVMIDFQIDEILEDDDMR